MKAKQLIQVRFKSPAVEVEVITTPYKSQVLLKKYLRIHEGYKKEVLKRANNENFRRAKQGLQRIPPPEINYKVSIQKIGEMIY